MSTDIAMGEAFDLAIQDLDRLVDRHFAARRTLVVSNDEGKFWTAAIGDNVLYRSPDGAATLRFAHTFAERTPGVMVEVEAGYSVRVGTLSERQGTQVHPSAQGEPAGGMATGAVTPQPRPSRSESVPDNVVPILGRVEA